MQRQEAIDSFTTRCSSMTRRTNVEPWLVRHLLPLHQRVSPLAKILPLIGKNIYEHQKIMQKKNSKEFGRQLTRYRKDDGFVEPHWFPQVLERRPHYFIFSSKIPKHPTPQISFHSAHPTTDACKKFSKTYLTTESVKTPGPVHSRIVCTKLPIPASLPSLSLLSRSLFLDLDFDIMSVRS